MKLTVQAAVIFVSLALISGCDDKGQGPDADTDVSVDPPIDGDGPADPVEADEPQDTPVESECSPPCASGTCCSGACVDLENDPENCGTCGHACTTGQTCVSAICTECTPDCEGRACGNDGCGGTCGECDDDEVCAEGACEYSPRYFVNCDQTDPEEDGSRLHPWDSVEDVEAYEAGTGFPDGADIYFHEGSTCTLEGSNPDLDIFWEGTGPGNFSIIGCYDDEDETCTGERPVIQRYGGDSIFLIAQPAAYLRIEHLSFRNTNPAWDETRGGNCISTLGDGEGGNGEEGNLIITDNEFYHCTNMAIGLARVGPRIVVTNNTITECGQGIYIIDEVEDGASHGYVAGNTCTDLAGRYDPPEERKDGHCVGLQSTDYFIVENNRAVNAYNGTYVLWTRADFASIHNVFRGNYNDGSRQACVDLYDADDDGSYSSGYGNKAYRNICIHSAAVDMRASIRINNLQEAQGNYVFNNTIYDANYWGVENRRSVDYSYWLNNIVVTDDLDGDSHLFHVQCNGNQGSHHVVDYNLFWSLAGDPSGQGFWMAPDDCVEMSWADWRADGWGGHDMTADPMFAGTTTFELQPTSPAVDAGAWLTHVSGVSGTTVQVGNTYILHGNYGLSDESGEAVDGMMVSFYDAVNGRQDREILSVDYGASIAIDSTIDHIYSASSPADPQQTTQIALRMSGEAPDIGAVE